MPVYLNPYPREDLWRAAPSITRFYDGAKARAVQLGFQWDEFWFRRSGLTQKRLDGVLAARGIRGLIIGSFPEARGHLRLAWPHYVAIAQGLTLIRPDLPRACNNYYDTMAALLRRLAKLGYRRPGFYIEKNSNERCRNIWLAAFLLQQHRERAPRQPPACVLDKPEKRLFEKWFNRHRPDVVVACDVYVRTWLAEMRLDTPEDVGFASFDCHPTSKWRGVSGMNHQIEICGAAAVDFVAGRLSRNESGLVPVPETIMTPAVWAEGETTAK
jgi:DNA-binding LacI/PurR family transcriptional regulator